MKKIVLGILAHVDAGKTTLTESILYLTGTTRKLGRVDHRDTFLDYDFQERNRGITIFSKQAIINWHDSQITLIDTQVTLIFRQKWNVRYKCSIMLFW